MPHIRAVTDPYNTFTLTDPFLQVGWHRQWSWFALVSGNCVV